MVFRIGIVGVGNVARQNYIPFLAAQPDVSLGYVNRTAARAEQAAAQHGGQVFADLAALRAWDPDVVFVLTAETARREICQELIERGVRRLFLEKPLVAAQGQAHVREQDFHDAKALLAAATARGCQTAMVFNYRFFDQTMAARRLVSERGFGDVIHVAALVHYACWSHSIDLIHHFAGGIEEICALEGEVVREGNGMQARDVTASLKLKSGATGTLIGTCGLQWHHPLYELLFAFEKGRIHLRDLDGDMEVLDAATRHQERWMLVRDGSRWTHYSASFAKSVGAYLDALRQGAEPPVPGIEGLRELQVEAAIRRSIAQRRSVRLQDEFPL